MSRKELFSERVLGIVNEKYLFSIFDKKGLNIDNIIITIKSKKDNPTDMVRLENKLHVDFKDIFRKYDTSRSSLVRIDDLREWVVDSKELK